MLPHFVTKLKKMKSTSDKLPEITILFWIMKICATTLGETGGDLLAQTMNVGYGISSICFLVFFFITVTLQLVAKKYHPMIYWMVILATSTAGTTISDFMDRTLGLGYAVGSFILILLLIFIFFIWKSIEKSLAVNEIRTIRAEIFYWTAILLSNTLGTALGDFLADSSGLGFSGGAILIGCLLILIILLHYYSKLSPILLFWMAFVLTRPFGATFGDLLTKPVLKGGFNVGTTISSILLFTILVILIFNERYKQKVKDLQYR